MIGQRIQEVITRINRACERSGRDARSVTLVAVSKTFPVSVVEEAYQAGIRHFGENKVQELKPKCAELPGLIEGGDIHWHMIGHVQRNKAKDVVACADSMHTLDSLRLARELEKRAAALGRVLPCMVQVNVSGESSKYGLDPGDIPAFMEEAVAFPHLEITGLMTLASPVDDPEEVRPQFVKLRSLKEELTASGPRYSSIEHLSMGMSGDFEIAIEEGATHVRIGSLLFGART